MGSYTLPSKPGAALKPTSAHTTMIGKAAPDLKADFAVNGKNASKLSDLKGKNVLLYFFDPRSSACMELLPKLEELSAAHKKNGLNIVGVTFYQYEIGQKLGWDKEEGKIITAKKADRESDQVLFKAFATHHKIDHPLWILTKAEALTAYDSCVVNGIASHFDRRRRHGAAHRHQRGRRRWSRSKMNSRRC